MSLGDNPAEDIADRESVLRLHDERLPPTLDEIE
jgi:hypothetical protein